MQEKVLIVAVRYPRQNEDRFQSSLSELQSLTETAQGNVLKIVTQNRERIHPGLYLGEGKIEEIAGFVEDMEIDLVISNDELSPSQSKNLSERLGVRIIDRSQLILDIFAQRANTREGKLQVELAQLQYMLPRLYGQGKSLSRLAGGIGTRGPGETKLESDRRHIRRRIDDIKARLDSIVKQRAQYRSRRKANKAFQIAIVGYTNAGKSTFFNRITKSQSLEEDQLFATLDPMTRQIQLPSGFAALITDTVGFIQDLPTTLIAAFRSTLEEVTEADFILHMVDASHPDQENHQATVNKLLKELGAENLPMLTVYNKKDVLQEEFIPSAYPSITVSAHDPIDLKRVLNEIEQQLIDQWEYYQVFIPASDSRFLQKISRQTVVMDREYQEDPEGYQVTGYIDSQHPLNYKLKG